MAGWSALTNGSALDCAEIIQSNGHCVNADHVVNDGDDDDDYDDRKDKARCFFDQLLSLFYEEVAGGGGVRTMPAMLGNGQSADLYELFWIVRRCGGYDFVSKKGLWAFVVSYMGLNPELAASVKLIYSKYLSEFDKWLKENGNNDGSLQNGANFGLLELKTEFRDLLFDLPYMNGNDDTLAEWISDENDNFNDSDMENSELKLVDKEKYDGIHDSLGKGHGDGDKKRTDDDKKSSDSVTLLDQSSGKKESESRKRKRQSFSGMLNWVIQVAKHPDDPAIGKIPGPSKWKDLEAKDFWMQVIRAREAQLLKRSVGSNSDQSLLQKKLKMHPSMYEDNVCLSHQSTERVRCSERVPTLVKSQLCPCCKPSSATHSKLESSQKIEPKVENASKEQTSATVDILPSSPTGFLFEDDPDQKLVAVGPLFQAEVPEWTGVVFDSDSKWLGTQTWPLPLENGQQSSLIEKDPIGRGRSDFCECRLPGSVECIRFHIAEKRMKLKQELKSAFYRWRFDQMGEEVSLQWTIEEEKRFKEMVRSNPPSQGRCFWDYATNYFPRKTRTDLVRYYFDVFLIRRRSYQNRVTPKDIDSDDDESEFGSLSESFGHDAITVRGSNPLVCTENMQCQDLE